MSYAAVTNIDMRRWIGLIALRFIMSFVQMISAHEQREHTLIVT